MIWRIFSLLILIFPLVCLALPDNLKFEHLTIKQGLSQNSIYNIVQGPQGFLWFATENGLNRFDGTDFKIYRHNQDDPHSISNNIIFSLHIDPHGYLWVGTTYGLNRFDFKTERFERFHHYKEQPNSLSDNWIWSLKTDDKQRLWVGTRDGVNLFDPETKQFTRFGEDTIYDIHQDNQQRMWLASNKGLHIIDESQQNTTRIQISKDDPNNHRANFIRSFTTANDKQLWLGTSKGLALFNLNDFTFTRLKPRILGTNEHFSHYISKIYKDPNGILWLGTLNNGLYRYDPASKQLKAFKHDFTNPYSISTNKITTINQDEQGSLWIGTDTGGLNKINFNKLKFGHVMQIRSNPNGLKHSGLYAIFKDNQQRVWAGSQKGLSIINPNRRTPSLAKALAALPILSTATIAAIVPDRKNNIWIATRRGKLIKFDQKNQQFSHQSFMPIGDTNTPSVYLIKVIQDNLWVGTNNGLYRKDLTKLDDRNTNQKVDIKALNSFAIRGIASDDKNNLWLATDHGLAYYQPKTNIIRHYSHQANRNNAISNNLINIIYYDRQGMLWVGTHGGGLNRFDPKTKVFTLYSETHGLSNNAIYAILPDSQGNLWLSTNKGLSKFNPSQETFRNYEGNDGLQSNEFNYGASFKARDGEFFFGGVNGFNRFYPQDIKDDTKPPAIALTEFLISNQPVAVNPDASSDNFSLKGAINSLDSLTLSYQQNLITFEFAALHFNNAMKNQYAYRLKGLNDNWISTAVNNRRATYTNLPSGKYQLQVKASNADGYWNEQGKTLDLIVTPPPWKTWWAYSIYALIVMMIFSIYLYSQHRKIKYQQTINARLKQIDKLKDEFLASTSHELRTPLNGIIGITESVIDGVTGPLSDSTKNNLSMVVSSGKRLSNLINDILDFSKLKNGSLMLHKKPIDLHTMIEVVLTLSDPLLTNPEVKLINNINPDLPTVLADENRLQQVLYNLIGNAIKYTEEGHIVVTAEQQLGEIIVHVTDTGVGIEPQNLSTIFNSFTQANDTDSNRGGAGLGLSVSKKLVQLHGGNLTVKSILGRGTTFTFNLTISGEQCTSSADGFQNVNRLHHLDLTEEELLITPVGNIQSNQPPTATILIVDDEPINRQVLHNHLSTQNFKLIEASGGEQALQAIAEQGPIDLILLDIMMPHISGYQVCSELRKKHPKNELPIIFLSAKNQVSDLMAGFSVGANDYLTKPVSKEELITRVDAHLSFLDIHRNLEQKVAARTEQLEHKNKQIVATQQKLVHAEKLASLGTLTAGVAHEINNPINYMHISQQNLVADLKKAQQYFIDLVPEEERQQITEEFNHKFEPLHSHLSTINEGTERIKHIVQDLRTFTQLDAAEQQTVVITDLLEATINLTQAQYTKFIDFEVHFSHQPSLFCNPAALNQVFMNLLVNASHAIKKQLDQNNSPTSKGKKGRIICECKQTTKHIVITVIDNGIGMDKQTQRKLFEPFFTTKEVGQGTGLGLSVSFGAIKQHGGSIEVESTPGKGSKFVVSLPVGGLK